MTTTATTMQSTLRRRSSAVPWKMFEDLFGLAFLTWIGFTITVLVITFAIAALGEVTQSVWDPASQVPRWFAFFIGLHLAMDIMPLHIAHGQTRRDFARRAFVFLVMFAAATAALVTLGFVIERVIYAVAGWPQTLTELHLYSSATDYPRIYLEQLLVMFAWLAGGALIGAGFYRDSGTGGLMVGVGLVAAALVGWVLGSVDGWGPSQLLHRFLDVEMAQLPLLVSVFGALAVAAGLLALTWRLVRDIPLKNKTA